VKAAQFVSVIFHPLLLTTYLVIILGRWMPEMLLVRHEHLLTFVAFIFGITFVLPAVNASLFRQLGGSSPTGWLTSMKMGNREERIVPFIIGSGLYVTIAVLFLYKLHFSTNFTKLMLIIAAMAVAGTVATFFSKISIHSLGWAGLVGIVLPLNNATQGTLLFPMVVVIVIAGLVMSARLRLNAHTPREVSIGGALGFIIGMGGMNVLF
jgi:membrane-associated phospholipid phosphatase